jgi:hypothetical protein
MDPDDMVKVLEGVAALVLTLTSAPESLLAPVSPDTGSARSLLGT